ncbi:MAG TPA: hypothetical protein PLY16_01405, partial [Candidatus Saccharibacteria bacterium]|nr:hypothetical protein [Candidatus Saccharibacteria bacterium]
SAVSYSLWLHGKTFEETFSQRFSIEARQQMAKSAIEYLDRKVDPTFAGILGGSLSKSLKRDVAVQRAISFSSFNPEQATARINVVRSRIGRRR